MILSDSRTGSTLLQTLLGSHPGIRFFYEPFHPKNVHLGKPTVFAGALRLLRAVSPAVLAAGLWSVPRSAKVKAVGFKLLYRGHLKFPRLMPYLETLENVLRHSTDT